MGANMHLLS